MDVATTTLKYDAERTNLSEYSKKNETETNRPTQGGVPGTAPNAISNRQTSLDQTEQLSKTKTDEREAMGVAGQTWEQAKKASFQVRRVRVSIGIPSSYYEKVFAQDSCDPIQARH